MTVCYYREDYNKKNTEVKTYLSYKQENENLEVIS